MPLRLLNYRGKLHAPTLATTALNYVRVSSDEQGNEGLSLDAQLADCRRYAAQHGWILGNEYQDILSGKRDDRPAYQAMLADLRQMRAEGRPVVVVVKWLHRLGRRVLERVRCREEMKAIGVALHSIAEGGEVPDLVANILASVAEEEVRQLGERVQAVNRHLARTGWARPGRPTWGYHFRPATTDERSSGAPKAVLEIESEAAPFAKQAFQKAANGASIREVQVWIDSLPEGIRGGRRFNRSVVRKVLRSPTYIACTDIDGELVPGRWPSLIDRAMWERVQERTAEHKRIPHQASGHYLSTGLLRCPLCGHRMHGNSNRLRSPVYRCHGIDAAGIEAIASGCNFGAKQSAVDAAVLSQVGAIVERLTSHHEAFRAELHQAWNLLQCPEGQDDLIPRVQALDLQRDRSQERLKRAALLFVDGQLDRGGYEAARNAAQADLDAATTELEKLRGASPTITDAVPDLDVVLNIVGGWSNALAGGDVPSQRDVLALLINRITPVRTGVGQYDVQIAWTPLGESLRSLAETLTR